MNQILTVANRYTSRQIKGQRPHALLLEGLKQPKPLQQLHGHIIASGLSKNIFLCNRLMNAYASCGLMANTHSIFSQILRKNLISWTILISGMTKNSFLIEAIEAFGEMIIKGFRPNEVTISRVLPAFGKFRLTRTGKSVHCYWIRQGFEVNVCVETGLVDMYMKLGLLSMARCLFDNMPERNVVTWNTMISGYADNGFGKEALGVYRLMRKDGISMVVFTAMSLISACLSLDNVQVGKGVHALVIRVGFGNDYLVKTSLMKLYVNVDFVDDAYCMFSEMLVKDVVAWTLMLTGFMKSGKWKESIEHFNGMMEGGGVALDSVSLTSILSCCSSFGALQQGRRIHGLVIKTGFECDIFVGSAAIDMYTNCADMEDARRFFEEMQDKDVACWNALIAGSGMNGYGSDAIDLFLKMKGTGINPDDSTLVSVLCACSHAGMVDEGLWIFNHMVDNWSVIPNLKHYACVIDLLGRAGRLFDAYTVIQNMHLPPGVEVYAALLSACKVHRNISLGVNIAKKLFELKPHDAGHYLLLSNMYALADDWGGVKLTRVSLRSKGFRKDPGVSSIEISGEVFTFMASQKDHPQYAYINEFLKGLILKIEEAGYRPDTTVIYQDVPDEMKKDILNNHSEKLAIAFGLMRTRPGTIIRITKNLRTCNDCHSASKFISKVFGRVLIIKDTNHFHVFQDGICTCRDYW